MRNPAAEEVRGAGPEGHGASLGSWDFILGCTPLCILEDFWHLIPLGLRGRGEGGLAHTVPQEWDNEGRFS